MNRIVELPAGQATEWSDRDRTFIVEHELKLHLANGVLSYETTTVAPYEKVYPSWQTLSTDGASFACEPPRFSRACPLPV